MMWALAPVDGCLLRAERLVYQMEGPNSWELDFLSHNTDIYRTLRPVACRSFRIRARILIVEKSAPLILVIVDNKRLWTHMALGNVQFRSQEIKRHGVSRAPSYNYGLT